MSFKWYLYSGYSLAGTGGGGGGGTPTEVVLTQALAESVGIGDVVSFVVGTGDAGKLQKASATTAKSRGIGIATSAGNAGQAVAYKIVGVVTAKFGSAPAATDNGKIVYVDSTAGQVTLTPPNGQGQSVVQMGYLLGGNGADSSVEIFLDTQHIADL